MKAGEYYIETCRGEDANIASPQGIQKPYQLDDPMVGFHCFANKEIHQYHERANAILPLPEHQIAIFGIFVKTFGNGTPRPFDHFTRVIV